MVFRSTSANRVRFAWSCVMCLSAESFCALAWATRASACASPALAVSHAAFFNVVILLGDEGCVVQTLGAVPVELGVHGVALGAVQVRERSVEGGIGGDRVGFRRCTEARVASTLAEGCTFSSWASNCPFFTRSPSLTCSLTILPKALAPMLT